MNKWVKAVMRNTKEDYLIFRYQDKIQVHEIVKYQRHEISPEKEEIILDSGRDLLVIRIKGKIFSI